MVSAPANTAWFLARDNLQLLVEALAANGREVIAPTVRDGAVVLAAVSSAHELPRGVGVENPPGRAQLIERDDQRVFDQPPGPTSWKRWTFPPRVAQAVWTD